MYFLVTNIPICLHVRVQFLSYGCSVFQIDAFFMDIIVKVVKLLAKSKLKSLPYNHTDHPPPTRNFESSLNKSIQVLHKHMIHFWNP